MRRKTRKNQLAIGSIEDMQRKLSDKIQELDMKIMKIVHDSMVAERELRAWEKRVKAASNLLKSDQDEASREGVFVLLEQAKYSVQYYENLLEPMPEAENEIFSQKQQVESKLKEITSLVEKENANKRLKETPGHLHGIPVPVLYERNSKENRDIDILVAQASGIIESRS